MAGPACPAGPLISPRACLFWLLPRTPTDCLAAWRALLRLWACFAEFPIPRLSAPLALLLVLCVASPSATVGPTTTRPLLVALLGPGCPIRRLPLIPGGSLVGLPVPSAAPAATAMAAPLAISLHMQGEWITHGCRGPLRGKAFRAERWPRILSQNGYGPEQKGSAENRPKIGLCI